jgi:hypothetical protein
VELKEYLLIYLEGSWYCNIIHPFNVFEKEQLMCVFLKVIKKSYINKSQTNWHYKPQTILQSPNGKLRLIWFVLPAILVWDFIHGFTPATCLRRSKSVTWSSNAKCRVWFEVRVGCSFCWYSWNYLPSLFKLCCRGRDRMVVEFTTTCAINAYHH